MAYVHLSNHALTSLQTYKTTVLNKELDVILFIIPLGHDTRKLDFRGLRTTKAQTSLTSVQSDQHLYYLLVRKYIKTCYN